MKRREIIINNTEIQRIVRNYYEQIYTKKFDNLVKMSKFLQTHNHPTLNQDKSESFSRPITISDIEAIIKKFLAYKSPRQESVTGKFYKIFREELTPILLKLFEKIQEGRLPNIFFLFFCLFVFLMRPILS